MELVLGWLVFSVAIGVGASARGRSGFGWFLLSIIISPLIAVILLALMPSLARPVDPKSGIAVQAAVDELRKCPECAELIKKEAKKCKHCGSSVEPVVESKSEKLEPIRLKQS